MNNKQELLDYFNISIIGDHIQLIDVVKEDNEKIIKLTFIDNTTNAYIIISRENYDVRDVYKIFQSKFVKK
jgi:hypothetical protein